LVYLSKKPGRPNWRLGPIETVTFKPTFPRWLADPGGWDTMNNAAGHSATHVPVSAARREDAAALLED
jgi:hypothetical protein